MKLSAKHQKSMPYGREEKKLTSRNWQSPSSPSAVTTSRPISLETYSCTMLMSAERNGVSCFGAMAMQLWLLGSTRERWRYRCRRRLGAIQAGLRRKEQTYSVLVRTRGWGHEVTCWVRDGAPNSCG